MTAKVRGERWNEAGLSVAFPKPQLVSYPGSGRELGGEHGRRLHPER